MKSITQLIILGTCLAISSIAWSIPLSTRGGIGTLCAPTTLKNSGAATEIEWIRGVLGISLDEFNNSGSPDTHFLFDNEFDRRFAVVDPVDMGFSNKNISNIGKISHIGSDAWICTAG